MAVTIHELALFRGIKADGDEGSSYSGAEYLRVGLPPLSGCESCHASLAAYNSCPSKTGMIRCEDCIGDLGYETAKEANDAIFGDSEVDATDTAIALLQEKLGAKVVEVHDE